MKSLFLAILFSICGFAQQNIIRPAQLGAQSTTVVQLLALTPAGQFAFLQCIDCVVDLTAKTVRPSGSLKQEVEPQTVTTVGQIFIPAFTPSPQSVLKVYRNGQLQRGEYTLQSGGIQFNASAGLQTGETVTLEYWH